MTTLQLAASNWVFNHPDGLNGGQLDFTFMQRAHSRNNPYATLQLINTFQWELLALELLTTNVIGGHQALVHLLADNPEIHEWVFSEEMANTLRQLGFGTLTQLPTPAMLRDYIKRTR